MYESKLLILLIKLLSALDANSVHKINLYLINFGKKIIRSHNTSEYYELFALRIFNKPSPNEQFSLNLKLGTDATLL